MLSQNVRKVFSNVMISNFNKHAKFVIIDHLTSTYKSKGTLTQRLVEEKIFGF